ncbi:MAG: hormogonium polysaccharide biosynthesis glycosyltransferase HpsE [Cyanobacteria bacterium J06560_5]
MSISDPLSTRAATLIAPIPKQRMAIPSAIGNQSTGNALVSLDVTVAIPTYNGAQRLPALLDQLRSQQQVDHLKWEVIVCDNNSTDDTLEVVKSYQADWPSQSPLRYHFGARQGAAFARQHAVECAKGELIAFLDDDNIPADNWVAEAYKFAQQHPEAGGFGSQIHGQFESELPDELKNIKTFLAIIERGDKPERYEPAKKMLPPAAGLVVRRSAWLAHVPPKLFLNNTSKSAGLASEDLEALLHIQKAGWDVWYNPNMVVHHDIPDGRLTKEYLVSLFRCVGLSCFHIRMLRSKKWDKPFAVPAHIANDIRKLALHRIRYGARQQLNTVDSCHRELLLNAVKSPLFLLNKARKDNSQAREDERYGDRDAYIKQLTAALEGDRFVLYQQSVVQLSKQAEAIDSIADSLPSQKELLLRLRTDENQALLPANFLSNAQHYGMIRAIDRWVIRRLFVLAKADATKSPSAQQLAQLSGEPLYSINLSHQSVQSPDLVQFIARRLAHTQLAPHLFCFEVPTSSVLDQQGNTQDFIAALRQLGCRVTLDNATIDRTVMNLLSKVPIDYLKINATAMPEGLSSQLPALMQQYSVQAIAKGIDSLAILETVKKKGIRHVQGYQIERPRPMS